MKNSAFLLAASLLLVAPQGVLAHGGSHAQHGGIVQMSGETLFELAGQPQGVSLYVDEEGDPINAKGYSATLTITNGGQKQSVPLAPLAGNRFFVKGVKLPKGARVAAQIVNNATKARTAATFQIK